MLPDLLPLETVLKIREEGWMQGARALHGHSTKLAKYASQVAGQRRNRNVLKVHEDFEYRATPQTPSAAIFETVSYLK